MSKLEERELTMVQSCESCKYCVAVRRANVVVDSACVVTDDCLFCFVDGVHKEDKSFVRSKMANMIRWGVEKDDDFRYLRIMQLRMSNNSFRESPRYIKGLTCCQFYEKKDEEK